ncbi:unnamed protein product, partial [Discosporangium mesarthrocarpum]
KSVGAGAGAGAGVSGLANDCARGEGGGGGGGSGGKRIGDDRPLTSSNPSPRLKPLYKIVRIDEEGEEEEEEEERGQGRPGSSIARTVWARMPVPAFVSPSVRGEGFPDAPPGGTATAVIPTGTLDVGFVVRVPRCIAWGERFPSAVVQYGHGLFGDRSEVLDRFLGDLAEEGAWMLVATDWRGMGRMDLPVVARALVAQPDVLFGGMSEDMMQGFVNMEAVLTLVSRRLEDFLGDGWAPPSPPPSPPALCFYGISQGAILGAGYTAFSSLVPSTNLPPPEGLVHMCVRHDRQAQMQVLNFYDTGCIDDFCSGPCDREFCSRSW